MEKNVKVNNVTTKNVNGKKEIEKNVKANNVTAKNINEKRNLEKMQR